MEKETFYLIVWVWIALAFVVFPCALFFTAPYGRHSKKIIGPMISNKLSWVLMEFPSLFLFGFFFIIGPVEKLAIHWVFFTLYMLHYFNRTFIWPLRTKTKGKKMPLVITISAIIFNGFNGPIIGYFLGYFSDYSNDWLTSWQFLTGIFVFLFGATINSHSDGILLGLRKPGETGYKIPRGGMFKYVSAPNLFGEVIEWTGWAIMLWSAPGLSFAVWTFANLVPRAIDHHKWYLNKFDDYPKERKAVFPYLW
jgi:hypothetical protein